MSLDVYLNTTSVRTRSERIFVRENGRRAELSREEWDRRHPEQEPVVVGPTETNEVYWRNITHNLGKMADAAGIYKHLWRPDEIGCVTAEQLIAPLRVGLTRLRADPDKFKAFNPANGWGDYDGLVDFVADYLGACEANPDAEVRVSR